MKLQLSEISSIATVIECSRARVQKVLLCIYRQGSVTQTDYVCGFLESDNKVIYGVMLV